MLAVAGVDQDEITRRGSFQLAAAQARGVDPRCDFAGVPAAQRVAARNGQAEHPPCQPDAVESERGIATITTETLYDAKAHYGR